MFARTPPPRYVHARVYMSQGRRAKDLGVLVPAPFAVRFLGAVVNEIGNLHYVILCRSPTREMATQKVSMWSNVFDYFLCRSGFRGNYVNCLTAKYFFLFSVNRKERRHAFVSRWI